ncbi:MAG: two component transcriptional regulator, winged helix family [Candidatus Solibacter sp.]|jgi:DNA-binding response OmpR family regulator|nr:two component transcriptional regulator, winged helix family [Candidatus Solibacter sp.]
MRILIVEDDRKLARQLKKGVDELGHSATLAFDGREGLESAQLSEFDVLVLDVMLPGLDGVSIVRQLRQKRIGTPILLLTARDTPEDVITGLDAGADDYLTKPFSFQVLLARLRALARRRQADSQTLLRIVDLSLDPATHEVRRANAPVSLSRTEFVILELLIRNPGRVITRARLIEAVWGHERDVQSNTVDVFIRQLRTKIEPLGASKLLHTIRGIGYTLREEDGA